MARFIIRLLVGALATSAVASVSLGTASAASLRAAAAVSVPKGQPDPSFGSGGFVSVPNVSLLATAVQSDGKVVAAGDEGNPIHLVVVRFNSDGTVDSTFNGGSPALGPANSVGNGVAIQPDGRILVAGASTSSTGQNPVGLLVERFNANGTPDGSFGAGGVASALSGSQGGEANAVAVQPDGAIIAGGSATGANAIPVAAFARFSSNGRPDSSFGSGGAESVNLGNFSVANGLVLQPDGQIVFAGSVRDPTNRITNTLAGRLNTNGSVDTSFAGGGFNQQFATGAASSAFFGVALQPNGEVVLAGSAADGTRGAVALFVRLTSGGGLDGSFGSGGVVKLTAATGGASFCGTCTNTPPPGANAVVVSAGEVFGAGYIDDHGAKRLALWALTDNGALDSGFGTGGSYIGALSGAKTQAAGLAVAPGGNLVVDGYSKVLFGGTTGFVARFGGPPVAVKPPPPPPPKQLKVHVSASRSYKINKVTGRSGLRLSVTCSIEPCRISASITVSYGTAKKLHLAPRHGHPKTVTIASGSTTLRRSTKGTVVLRFTGAAKRALSRTHTVRRGRRRVKVYNTRSLRTNLKVSFNAASTTVNDSITVRLVR